MRCALAFRTVALLSLYAIRAVLYSWKNIIAQVRFGRLIPSRHIINAVLMLTIGYVRVSTDRQAEHGVSLEAQEAKIRAMATVQGAELLDVIVDGGESAKSLNRPGLQRIMALVNSGKVQSRPQHHTLSAALTHSHAS